MISYSTTRKYAETLVVVLILSAEGNISLTQEDVWSYPQPIRQNFLFSFTEMLSFNNLTFETTCTDLTLRFSSVSSRNLRPITSWGEQKKNDTSARKRDLVPRVGSPLLTQCLEQAAFLDWVYIYPGTTQCKYDLPQQTIHFNRRYFLVLHNVHFHSNYILDKHL